MLPLRQCASRGAALRIRSTTSCICTSAPSITASCRHFHRTTAANAALSSSSSSAASRESAEVSPVQPTRAEAKDNNLSRVRELLQEVDPQDCSAFFRSPTLVRRREVWPTPPLPRPSPLSTSSSSTTAQQQQQQEEEIRGTHYRSTKAISTLQKAREEPNRHPLYWYGAPPGAVRDVDYFTSELAAQWNAFFHTHYYQRNQPTAPLLRCPACAAHLLRREGPTSDAATQTQTLWLDPPSLDRHLSWVHADQLYTSPELAPYNHQVLQELLHACGLSSTAHSGGGGAAGTGQTARLILAVDVANTEISQARGLLDVLLSSDLRRIFSQVPVAFCATHELFVPISSKVLHALYQLARLHSASTLHVFAANTSMESGDLMTAHYINELILSSTTRAVPPIVLLTRDGQQRQVAHEMRGMGQRTLSPLGVVRCASAVSVVYLVDEIRAALTGGLWTV